MGNSSSSCPVPPGSENYDNQGTAWKPMVFVALACTAATTGIALSLIILHLRRYRSPKEQRQIIRIVFSVVVYSLVAFFELWQYEIAQYIDPIGDLYEAFGLCALYLLYIQYAAPSGTFDEETFATVKAAEENESNFNWPKLAWIFVFQYPMIEALCIVLQEATEATGTYCLNSLSPKYAHLWVQIFESISIGACVLAILRFRGRMKNLMKVRRGFSKLIAFKIIVAVRFFQQWIFSVLLEDNVINPGNTLSYNDVLYGIPSVLTCAEMVLFSLGFWYAFSSTEYNSKAKPGEQPLPLHKAILDALNPWDLIVGMARIFPLIGEVRRSGDWQAYKDSAKEQGLQGAIRKGVRKYKGRKNNDYSQGYYQELDDGMESLTRPAETHHAQTESNTSYYQDTGYYSTSGGTYGQEMYQPPEGSPPDESSGHLMAGETPSGRLRSSSQSHLSTDAPPLGRPRGASQSSLMQESQQPPGYYDRAPSPNFTTQPTQGREAF